MFRFEGFKFGWFMTLTEVVVMIFGALASEGVALHMPPGGRQTWAVTAVIGLCVSLSHGCGNTALRFSSYPLKVAFKSCKLVPTMAIGFCINGRRHSLSAYLAALVMCMGLFLLSISDATIPKSSQDAAKIISPHELFLKSFVGPLLLLLSTSMDSVVPNLQEHLFQKTNIRTVDLIFLSNIFMILILFLSTVTSGELRQALVYCRLHPRVLGVLTLQSASAYCGLRCYLTVIKKLGGAAGVLLANARKIVTILLSFVIFRKPCRSGHVSGLCLIFVGVYLGLMNKKGKKKKKFKNNDTTDSNSSNDAQDKRDHNV
jgi:adenosine 3'-phospho 5'-phosphosulfate transporter B3